MYKETIIYSISIGLNRGGILIFMPFIVKYLGVADYGGYNYVQILMQFLFPFLCFNIPSSITYIGAYNIEKSFYLLKKFIPYIIIATIFFSSIIGGVGYQKNSINFLFWGVLLGGTEALHNMILAYLRVINRHYQYGLFTILKTLLFIFIILILRNLSCLNLSLLLISQTGLHIILFFLFYIPYLKQSIQIVNVKESIRFSLSLLPHIIALWIMNASSRFIVKQFGDSVSLGVFSIAY